MQTLHNHGAVKWLLVGVAVFASGCASDIPDAIRNPPPHDPQVDQVLRVPERFLGADVRWGGSIVSVRNLKNETQIEVVARRLDSDGRPAQEDQSQGRFLAKVTGFFDPAIYATGREVTVHGRIDGTTEQTIGEFRYTYPVVRADHLQLWEKRAVQRRYNSYDPYYDPYWYDPWYPWGPWGSPFSPYYRPWRRF